MSTHNLEMGFTQPLRPVIIKSGTPFLMLKCKAGNEAGEYPQLPCLVHIDHPVTRRAGCALTQTSGRSRAAADGRTKRRK
jgi:hypothetical protein